MRRLPGDLPLLEAWRRDYNEAQPHSKLNWLTPDAYARALTGEIGRPAALVDGCADRPLANPPILAQINQGHSLWLDEKRGSRHLVEIFSSNSAPSLGHSLSTSKPILLSYLGPFRAV